MTRILIVDDLSEARYMLRALLSAHGHEVIEARDGEEALSAARRDPPNLIITDILMPRMDGYQLCRSWRADEGLKAVPFIFYTATYTSKKDQEFGLSLGADRFVIKPQEPARLVEIVLEVMSEEASTSQVEGSAPIVEQRYSEVLFRKLEKKMADLQRANRRLEQEMVERKKAEARRREAESQLRQLQKMQSLGLLGAGLAHDFNNILTAIAGNTQLARSYLSCPAAKRQVGAAVDCLDIVVDACAQASSLTAQILAFGTETEGEQVPLHLQLVVGETLRLVEASLPGPIELVVDLDDDCPQVRADAAQIHQAVMNLCLNAGEAMGDKGGGRVTVRLTTRDVVDKTLTFTRRLVPGRYVVLEIADQGVGIARDDLTRIFEPYFTTKASRGGSGLGLAVVYRILQTQGAALQVESEPGKGTTFTILFSTAVGPQKELRRTLSGTRVALTGKERVLFVDDLEMNLRFVKEGLEDLGYRVTTSGDGAAAIDAFRQQPEQFDVVITDAKMPGLDGIQVAEGIRRIDAKVPILLCSGTRLPAETSDQVTALAISAVLQKPATHFDLAATIRAVIAAGGEGTADATGRRR